MSGETTVQFVWFLGAFTLVLSALIARRLPMKDWMKLGLAWVGIFALVVLIISALQTMT